MSMVHTLADWINLALHFLSMSLLAIGGAIAVLPESHRFLVNEHQWLTDTQFSSSIALAQAAPGPNALMLGMLGWNFGLNAAPTQELHYWYGTIGFFMATICALGPSCFLTYTTTKWVHKNSERRGVIAFKLGMAPVVIGVLLASSWILVVPNFDVAQNWPRWLMTFFVVVLVWRTKVHMLILLTAGAILGGFGLV